MRVRKKFSFFFSNPETLVFRKTVERIAIAPNCNFSCQLSGLTCDASGDNINTQLQEATNRYTNTWQCCFQSQVAYTQRCRKSVTQMKEMAYLRSSKVISGLSRTFAVFITLVAESRSSLPFCTKTACPLPQRLPDKNA